ncbi:hypothetical protein N0V82_004739 [Gnomoniopsis sp. IMI 355080]|nr:hypothetical protein N0V82_004739 [Gnomoniopsis sp. IMI 355080]
MGYHVPGDESPFLKRILIPFWVVRIFIMGIDIIAYGLVIGVLGAYQNNDGNLQTNVNGQLEDNDSFQDFKSKYNVKSTINAAIAVLSVILVLILLCLVLDFVCIFKRSRRTLTPKFFLIVNVVQTTFWTVMFVLSFFGAYTTFAHVLSIIPYLSFVGLLIYASIIFHKSRKGTLGKGTYAPADNSGQQLYAMDTSYATPAAPPYGQNYPDSGYYSRKMDSHDASLASGDVSHEQGYGNPSYGNNYNNSHDHHTTSSIV